MKATNSINQKLAELTAYFEQNSVDDLVKSYKAIEVTEAKKAIALARYSEFMQKRMIKEARSKTIAKGRREYIAQLIVDYDKISNVDLISDFEKGILKMINDISKEVKEPIGIIVIEHDALPESTTAYVYADSKEWRMLTSADHFITFEAVWGFFENRKFGWIHEWLEGIEVGGHDFIGCLIEMYSLRGNQIIDEVFQLESVKSAMKELPFKKEFLVTFGEHDCEPFQIYNHNSLK